MSRVAPIAGVVICVVVAVYFWPGKRDEPQAKANSPAHQPPRAVVTRVPCKLKFGPLAAALEVDLSEVRNLGLDGKQLYDEIVRGEPGAAPPALESPAVMVVN